MATQAIKYERTGPEGAERWEMNTLPATVGLKVLTQLIGMLGKPLGILSGIKSDGDGATSVLGMEVSGDMIAKAFSAISESIDDPRTVDLVTTLLSGLRKNGRAVNFDVDFAGAYAVLLFELVPWALKGNFADFFDGASGLPAFVGKITTLASIRAPSTGASGESSPQAKPLSKSSARITM